MALTKIEKEKAAFRERENERKRRWREKKRLEKSLKNVAGVTKSHPQKSINTERRRLEKEGMKVVSHLQGKKKMQFKKEQSSAPPPPAPRRRLRFRLRRSKAELMQLRRMKAARKAEQKFEFVVPEAHEPDQPDVVEEQVEKPQTTKHSPESIKEDGLKEVKRNPEYYIEINMVTKSRVVDTFYIPSERKTFHYKKKEYKVDEEAIYLLPTKLGLFMPTCHYKEGTYEPKGFRQTNRGITGKALSLLYMEQLYTSLLYSEDIKYNLFIVILSIAILIAYGIGCYFLFFHSGGLLAPGGGGGTAPQVVQMILPWRF
jgi:hypothetical protein